MPLYLIYRTAEADKNAARVHACLVAASSEEVARALAIADRPNGEVKVPATWACVVIADAADLPINPLWFSGDVLFPGREPWA